MADKKFVVESAEIVHKGAVVYTEVVHVRTPDGDVIERQVVRHPGAVSVVVVHEGNVVLVEQYRAALDANLIEIPAGKCDIVGEELETAARRETIEEVGLEPRSLTHLGTFHTAAGFSDEAIAIFFSDDCVHVGRQVDGVEEEHSEILHVPLDEIDRWMNGKLTDAKSIIGLFWARDKGLLNRSSS